MNEHAVRRITKYLASTSTYVDLTYVNIRLNTHGIVYNTDIEKGIKCYVDAEFSGGRAQVDADNAENVMSHTGHVIMYSGCPLLWYSKLHK